jgi:tRNA pseudouridine32 synthase/23S rRNA pseudouridine746 synthase
VETHPKQRETQDQKHPVELQSVVRADEQDTLCNLLSKLSGLSKIKIKHAMRCGAVWLKKPGGKMQRARRATTAAQAGDLVAIYYDETILNLDPPRADCVQDGRRYSIWFKPAGLMTQGSLFGDHCALTHLVERHFTPRRAVFPVHRIDRETCGLVLVAHDRRAAALFSELFQKHHIEKHYQALAIGKPANDDDPRIIDLALDGRPAQTRYTMLRHDSATNQSLVEIQTITGRRHQIRRHFDLIGHPIVGDPLYGRNNKNQQGLRLVAYRLRFRCPITRALVDIEIDPVRALS